MSGRSAAVVRVLRKVEIHPESGCWIFTGANTQTKRPYGQVRFDGLRYTTHRLLYEEYVGPVPEGLVLDHVEEWGCISSLCCRPDHLEAVTQQENTRRARARETHCPNGHPYGNVKPGYRKCSICKRTAHQGRQKRYRQRLQADPAKLDERNRKRRERYAMMGVALEQEEKRSKMPTHGTRSPRRPPQRRGS